MARDQTESWVTFSKIDNISVTEFLLSTASVLSSHQLLTKRTADQLRVAASSLQGGEHANAILVSLIEQNSEFIDLLQSRFGSERLASNIFRHTLQSPLGEIINTLVHFGQGLLEKMDLLFNKEILQISNSNDVTDAGLFSDFISHYVEILSEKLERLRNIAVRLTHFQPSVMHSFDEKQYAIDAEIAASIDMKLVDTAIFLSHEEIDLKQELVFTIDRIMELTKNFLISLHPQLQKSDKVIESLVLCDWLIAENKRFDSLKNFELHSSLRLIELQRINAVYALSTISNLFKELTSQVKSLFVMSEIKTYAEIPFDKKVHAQSYLCNLLLEKGAEIKNAKEAVGKLVSYTIRNNCSPSTLIESELTKIHPLLTADLITKINVSVGTQTAKSHVFARRARLNDKFTKVMLSVALLAIFSCGLKTNPQSDVDDLRPKIPFRDQPITEKKDTQKNEFKTK